MGSLCGTLFGSSASTTYQPPAAVTGAITDILNRAATQSNQPYPQYTPETAAQYQNYNAGLVAPMSPNQVQAGQSIANLQGYTQPYFQAATNMAAQAANPLQMQQFSQNAINQYMNPYLNNVVGAAVANINQTNAQQQQQVLGNAIQRGAFGGDRAGIAQAELARQQGLANNATIANLLGQGYSQAQQQFNTQQATDLATQLQNRNLLSQNALNLANLGTQGQQAGLQQAQAQYGYGTAEQQQQQAGLSTAYQQYMNKQAFPYQQLSYYAGLASGAAPAMGGTTTGYSPTLSPYNALSSLGTLGTMASSGSSANPFLSLLGGIFKSGGRVNYERGGVVGYADGGAPSASDPIIQAYNDYQMLAKSGNAPPAVVRAAYQKYLNAFNNAPAPWTASTAAATATKTPLPMITGGSNVSAPSDQLRGASAVDNGANAGNVRGAGASDYNALGDQTGLDRFGGSGTRRGLNLGNAAKGLLGGVNEVTGAQTGILGAANALFHGNTPGTYNQIGTGTNMVADPSQGGRDLPNTSSGLTAQQYADQFTGGDISKVGAGFTNVNGQRQVDFFNLDNAIGRAAHFGYVPASQLDPSLVGTPTTKTDETVPASSEIDVSKYTGPTDLGTTKSSANPFAGMSKADFISAITPMAENIAEQTGLTPQTVMAQAALETGYGQHMVGGNLFGIKGVGTGAVDTTENVAGLGDVKQKASFAAYPSAKASFDAYGNLMSTNPRYAGVLAAPDTASQLAALGKSGYATDPQYGSKLAGINKQIGLLNIPSSPFDYATNTPPGVVVPSSPREAYEESSKPINVQPETGPSASTEGHEPGAGVRTAGTTDTGLGGVGAAGEGHGGLGRDTSISNDPRVNEAAMHDISQPDQTESQQLGPEGEKRGGRIHPHHYAQGGYTPFSMDYGLTTSSDLSQAAQDVAGSGVGILTPQQEALAAQGVLPAATGGRIHAKNGASIPAGQDAGLSDMDLAVMAGAGVMPPPDVTPNEMPATPIRAPSSAGQPPVIDPQTGNLIGFGGDIVGKANLGRGMVEKPGERAAAMGQKTEAIIPKVSSVPQEPTVSADKFDLGQATAPEPTQRAPANVVAQDTTRKTSDAAQPGFGYIAPPPMDRDYLAKLAFWAAGSRPGAGIGEAANAYANSVMANQGQQRETMTSQAQAAQGYAAAQNLQTQAMEHRIMKTPDGLAEIFTDPDGHIFTRDVTPQGEPAGQFKQLPSLPGADGKPIAPTEADAAFGPIYTGADVPATSIGKDQTLQVMAAPYKRQALGTNAPVLQKQFGEMKDAAQGEATAAQNTQTDLGMAVKASSQLGASKFLSPGAAIGLRTSIASYLKTLGDVVGFDMSGVTSDNLTSQQVLNKVSTLQAQAQHRGLGREAGFWLNTLKQAYPNESMTKEAGNDLLANMIVSNGRAKDRANVYTQYGKYSNQMGADAPQVFEKVNPSSSYGKDISAVSDILNHTITGPDGKPMNMVTALQDGKLIGGVAKFDEMAKQRYGVSNLSRYFQ